MPVGQLSEEDKVLLTKTRALLYFCTGLSCEISSKISAYGSAWQVRGLAFLVHTFLNFLSKKKHKDGVYKYLVS